MNKRGSILFSILLVLVLFLIVLYFTFKGVVGDENNKSSGAVSLVKQNAAISSIYAYISEIEVSIAKEQFLSDIAFDGKYSLNQINNTFDMLVKGEEPTEAIVCIDNSIVSKGIFKIKDYIISYDGTTAQVTNSTELEEINC